MQMANSWFLVRPSVVPVLDSNFRPAVLANRKFRKEVEKSGNAVPVVIAIEGADETISTYCTKVFPKGDLRFSANLDYVERLLKFLLWQKGGWRVIMGGEKKVAKHIKSVYSKTGKRAFDIELMSDVYEKPFTVEITTADQVPCAQGRAKPLGRHLEGCRIGFDLGASDRKVAAVINGKSVFSEEVVWNPKEQADPKYHYDEILACLKSAASHLPHVDSIGGSAAGIYVNNRIRVASLFRSVPKDLFDRHIRELFVELQREWNGIPFEVINDGEVTALAGSMSLGVNRVLGIAMGSSLAAGYVDKDGNIPGWLDELAFAPVDYHPDAPADEWSGDKGCGAQYFSQVAVNRLARKAGIKLNASKTLAERLKDVQALIEGGDERAMKVYQTIGVYFGYAIAHYASFYDIEHLLMLGRVTSGKGGNIIKKTAEEVIKREFPDLAGTIKLIVPDEASRRVGQAIAAASLPAIEK